MKRSTLGISGLSLCLAVAVSGCGGAASSNGGNAPVVDGGTFTFGLSSDPGSLDPQMGAGTSLFTVTQFAYDPLVSVDGQTGDITSELATRWELGDDTVKLTLADGITCADGAKLTATNVADNLDFVADPNNKSPFLGTFYPVGATAEGDDAAGTVTIT